MLVDQRSAALFVLVWQSISRFLRALTPHFDPGAEKGFSRQEGPSEDGNRMAGFLALHSLAGLSEHLKDACKI